MHNYKNIIAIAFLLSCKLGVSQHLSTNQWVEDIDFLTAKMAKIIPDFEKRVDQDLFRQHVLTLKANLPELTIGQIVVSLQKILSLVQDEGCSIYPLQPALNYKIVPLKSYWFKEGIFICDAADEYKHLVHQKIIAINGIQIDSVYAKMESSLSADNDNNKKYMFLYLIKIPSLLVASNIGINQNQIDFTLASGKIETVVAKEVNEYVLLKRDLAGFRQLVGHSDYHFNENYWMEYLPESKSLFIQFLQIRNSNDGISYDNFIKEVEKFVDTSEIEKLIIDNRYGGGGNGFKLKSFTDLVRGNKAINQKGKLFILTSRSTRGTVMELTSILELNTNAVIIGEPTGEGPNTVGDIKFIELPNSKIKVSLTHIFWPTSWAVDTRKFIEPEVLIKYSFEDYVSKKDPWMEEVERYETTSMNKPLSKDLMNQLEGYITVNKRKLKITKIDNNLFVSMKRKMKSFFELHSQIYPYSEDVLSTDITDVFIHYTRNITGDYYITSIDWKGEKLKIEN